MVASFGDVQPRARAWWMPSIVVVAALPVLASFALAAAGVVDATAPWNSSVVAAFAALATLGASVGTGRAAARGFMARAAAWAVIAVASGEVVAWWATRTVASIDIGVGEEGARWVVERSPHVGDLPAIRVLDLPSARSGLARLDVGGREVMMGVGATTGAGVGRILVLREINMGPAFTVRRANGEIEGEGLLKLVPGRRDWLEVGTLPHRFYVTLSRNSGDAIAITSPVHLRVQRGKISVFEGDIGVGETVRAEGISAVFEQGMPWGRFELRSRPTGAGAIGALLLATLAWAVGRWKARRGG